MEVEDDVFFAEMNKQISLLIMDDEDPATRYPSVSHQAFPRSIYPAAQSSYPYQQNCRESKGTGVFIPKSSHPRRKNRQGKLSSSNTKFQRHSDQNSRELPHATCTNNPSQSSFKSC